MGEKVILYLSSQKFGTDTTFLKEWIIEHDNKLLLIFNALDAKGQEKIDNNVNDDISLLEQIGFEVKVLDLKEYFDNQEELKQICQKYNSFCVMGGNVFVLRQAMKYSGFDTILEEKKNDMNCLYIGYSSGCCVLSKDISIYKDVDEPISFYKQDEIIYDCIGFIDYVFVPHYKSNYHKVHLIDELVDLCQKNRIEYKALTDGEVSVEKI
jgi:dipeptidase E